MRLALFAVAGIAILWGLFLTSPLSVTGGLLVGVVACFPVFHTDHAPHQGHRAPSNPKGEAMERRL